jgi:23S rRNA (uracil1939-C5)-methyltransferase
VSGRRAVVRLQEQPPETASVLDMTADGRGIASLAGKRVFINGTIRGEVVTFRRTRRRRNYDEAELVAVVSPSADRVTPP